MSNTKSSNGKIPPVNYKSVIAEDIHFTKLEKNDRNNAQKISFVRYRNPPYGDTSLVIQTPKIRLSQHGIPSLGKFYKKDEDRQFIKLPYDPSQLDTLLFRDKLLEIDTMVQSRKQELIGKHADKFVYSSLVKTPQDTTSIDDDDDDDDDKKKKPQKQQKDRFLYTKAKFDINFDTKQLNTTVYRTLTPEEAKEKGVKREKMGDIKTMEQLADFVKFNSTVRLLVMVNKLWAATAADKTGKYGYGLGLKIIQIEVEHSESKGSVKDSFKDDAFIDDDDYQNDLPADSTIAAAPSNNTTSEENTINPIVDATTNANNSTNDSTNDSANDSAENDDEDGEDDEDDDNEDDGEVQQPVAAAPAIPKPVAAKPGAKPAKAPAKPKVSTR